MRNVFEEIIYGVMLSIVWLLGCMPLSISRCCGAFFGRICFTIARRRRRITIENLSIGFPQSTLSERKRLASHVFQNLGKLVFETLWTYRLDEEGLFNFFRIVGRENIDSAFAEGRGVLTLTAHFGNWELLTVIGAILGYPVSIVYRPLDFQPLERLVRKLRTRFGARQIPRKKALRQIVRALSEKDMIGLLCDQHVARKEGIPVNFFERPASTSKGLALLALKTEAPVIPLFLVREKNGFVAYYLPKVPLIQTGDKARDVQLNTARYNCLIEDMVRRYPEQWLWAHRRWRK